MRSTTHLAAPGSCSIHSHQPHYRNFKAYSEHLLPHLRQEFPGRVSYTRFVDYILSALIPLCVYFQHTCPGGCTGISFIDSTSLDVCLNQRIAAHEVFAGLAARGKTSTGGFSALNCARLQQTFDVQRDQVVVIPRREPASN